MLTLEFPLSLHARSIIIIHDDKREGGRQEGQEGTSVPEREVLQDQSRLLVPEELQLRGDEVARPGRLWRRIQGTVLN